MSAGVDGTFNIVDVRDLASGCIAAVDKGRCGECYILANDVIAFKDFANMAIEERGGKKIKFFIPIKLAGVMGTAMEAAAKITGDELAASTKRSSCTSNSALPLRLFLRRSSAS